MRNNKQDIHPCISVIIPVYNVEKYVAECLQSVVDSDIQYPLECIIVDDCGSDNSMDIVRDFIANYEGPISFILITHERNQGLSIARNTGIENARGEYVYFLDSDDSITVDGLRKLYDKVIEYPHVDMVVGGMFRGPKQPDKHFGLDKFRKRNYIEGNSRLRRSYLNVYNSTCNKLIRLDFIKKEHLFFLPHIFCEDFHWCLRSYFFISSMAVIQDVTYFYRPYRTGSIMKSLLSDSSLYRKTIEIVVIDILSMNVNFDIPIKLCLLRKALSYKYNVIKNNGSENPNRLLDDMIYSNKFSFIEMVFLKMARSLNFNRIADVYLKTTNIKRFFSMKILYTLNSITTRGGMETITVQKANALAEIPGYEVYIIVTDNEGDPVIPLHPNVQLVDLEVNYYKDDWKSKAHLLYSSTVKRLEHKSKLKKVLNRIQPDIVISVGQSEKYMIPSIKGSWKRIREYHYTRNYRDFTVKSGWDKMKNRVADYLDRRSFSHYDQIVVLTEEDKQLHWKGVENVCVIPNFSKIHSFKPSQLMEKRVIAVGRLAEQKNFSSLVRSFRWVVDRHPDWNLDIYGDGPQKRMIEEQIQQLNLEKNICLHKYTSSVADCLSESSIFVQSSLFEGFGLALVEAMSCGLPVVSYACPCGPKDVIMEGRNGFLVPVNDENLFADRISYLIEHEDIRKHMGYEAFISSHKYTKEAVISRWIALFETLVK